MAGLSVALSLASKGISSSIFESRLGPGNIDRGDVLHQRSVRSLMGWGLSHIERFGAQRLEDFKIYDGNQAVLLDWDLSSSHPSGMLFSLGHREIEQMLWAAAQESPLIEVFEGTKVLGLCTHDHSFRGVKTKNGNIDYELGIICAGHGSTIMNDCFDSIRFHDYGHRFLNFRFRHDNPSSPKAAYAIGRGQVLIYLALPNGVERLGIQVKQETNINSLEKSKIIEKMESHFPFFKAEDKDLIDIKSYNLRQSLIRRHSKIKGILPAGDSYHTFHPVFGFGMNMAIEDAKTIGRLVEQKLLTEPRESLEHNYFRSRSPEVRKIGVITHQIERLTSTKQPLLILIRNALTRWIGKSARVRVTAVSWLGIV